MNKPVFRVVGLDQATCEADYCGAETATKPTNFTVFRGETPSHEPSIVSSDAVTVRLKDLLPALAQAHSKRLSWVRDFEEDPVVVTRDLYEVLLTLERLKNAA